MTASGDATPNVAIKTNSAMAALLASHPGAAEIFVPSPFQILVYGGFKDVEGCVFFRAMFPYDNRLADAELGIHQDKTGFECAVNRIHLEDYFEKGMAREAPSLALTAVRCAAFLANRLRRFSTDPFRIIASVDDRNCTLRFHKVRNGESWIVDDIESYEQALFVMDTAHR
jgi:hypothetical protein